jgi:hypothetical protein
MAAIARLCLLLASVLCTAQATGGINCCVPDQFMINLGQLQGLAMPTGPALSQVNSIQLACDFTNKRVGEEIVSITSGYVSRIKIIIDYAKNAMYTITEDMKCTKSEARGIFEQCIPKNAQYVDTTVIGNNELKADVYSYYANVEHVFRGNASISVSHRGCIPVGVSLIGEAISTDPPIPMVSAGGYSNFTMGIRDPGRWFDVPAICQGAQPIHRRFAPKMDAISDNDQQLLKLVSHMAMSPFVRH